MNGAMHIPLGLELLQALKLARYALVGQQRLVLAQRALANLRVLGLGDGIFEEGLFELVERDDDAEELREGVLQVALGSGVGELHFLWEAGCQRELGRADVDGRTGERAPRRGLWLLRGSCWEHSYAAWAHSLVWASWWRVAELHRARR